MSVAHFNANYTFLGTLCYIYFLISNARPEQFKQDLTLSRISDE